MEPLAFVEVVDRHRDVLARHPVYRWPITVGRAYDADVILDDPFIAPRHATVEPAGPDRFRIADLGTLNGIVPVSIGKRADAAETGPDDVVRLGHTQIRIRTASYAVPNERLLQTIPLYRRPAAFVLVAILVIAISCWNGWIVTNDEDDRYGLFFAGLGMFVLLTVWIALWSFVGSTSQRTNFVAHGFVACAGLLALTAADSSFEYLSFAFDAGWLEYIGAAMSAGVFAYMIYRHLLLNSRARRRTLALTGAGISVAMCGVLVGIDVARHAAQKEEQRYSSTIKAPAFLLVSGISPETFMSDAEKLKKKVNAMVKKDVTDSSPSAARPSRGSPPQ